MLFLIRESWGWRFNGMLVRMSCVNRDVDSVMLFLAIAWLWLAENDVLIYSFCW